MITKSGSMVEGDTPIETRATKFNPTGKNENNQIFKKRSFVPELNKSVNIEVSRSRIAYDEKERHLRHPPQSWT